ncbi:MAG: hypothetical protein AAB699_01520 [Patescibacteria group bacterium]
MTTTLTIKNGIIRLPKQLQKRWEGSKVSAEFSPNTLVIKRAAPAQFWAWWPELKEVGKKITKRDIDEAIRWVRRNKR